jgi:hypothetical protein
MKTARWLVLLALAASLAAAPSDEVTFTAASVNVAEPGTPVTIKVLRWSTDEERTPILAALNPAPPPAMAAGNRGAATAGDAAAAGTAARGRGAAGRGRGRANAAPANPIDAFTAALGRAPTIGYIWTSDITGYAIKYAWHAALPDGTERVILASDRRLGANTNGWKATARTPETDYAFTLIELRVGPKGSLEGKTSLTSRIAIDNDAKTVALDNYATAPTSLSRPLSPLPSQRGHR